MKTQTRWYGDIEAKNIRRVRTPQGAEKFGQPIGTIIVADLPDLADFAKLTKPAKSPITQTGSDPLKSVASEFEGWYKYSHSTGDYYIVKDDEGDWLATDPEDNILFVAPTMAKVKGMLQASVQPKKGERPTTALKPKEKFVPLYSGGTTTGIPLRPVTDEEKKKFMEESGIKIPPAWTDVHITTDPYNAHLLAQGTASNGKRQPLYSAAHRQGADVRKFARVAAIHKDIKKLDAWLEENALDNDTAAALLLMRTIGMRPGGEKSHADIADSYGATTLLKEHINVTPGGTTTLKFRPGKKKGDDQDVVIKSRDKLLAEVMRNVLERHAGRRGTTVLLDTTPAKTNTVLKRVMGSGDYKVKDLRTYVANRIALAEVKKRKDKVPKDEKELKKMILEVSQVVANTLGNDAEMSRDSYINPEVFHPWATAMKGN